MSSYLSFYIVPRRKSDKEPKRHILISSYSRNSDIYKAFEENISIVWSGDGNKYTTLTQDNVNLVQNDLANDISKTKDRLVEYEKYASSNPEYIQEIIETKEYLSDLQYTQAKISFIADMLEDMNFYDNIEEICCHFS